MSKGAGGGESMWGRVGYRRGGGGEWGMGVEVKITFTEQCSWAS